MRCAVLINSQILLYQECFVQRIIFRKKMDNEWRFSFNSEQLALMCNYGLYFSKEAVNNGPTFKKPGPHNKSKAKELKRI